MRQCTALFHRHTYRNRPAFRERAAIQDSGILANGLTGLFTTTKSNTMNVKIEFTSEGKNGNVSVEAKVCDILFPDFNTRLDFSRFWNDVKKAIRASGSAEVMTLYIVTGDYPHNPVRAYRMIQRYGEVKYSTAIAGDCFNFDKAAPEDVPGAMKRLKAQVEDYVEQANNMHMDAIRAMQPAVK